MSLLTVLGIPVTEEEVERWLGFYAPGRQPFRTRDLPAALVDSLPAAATSPTLHANELRDTFFVYGGGAWVWLSEDEFDALPPEVRSVLAGERAVRMRPKPVPAWPSDPMVVAKLLRWVEAGVRTSLHALVPEQLRRASEGPLPRAAELAGRFPAGSGPNCFAAVMAAAGEPVEHEWVQLDQFQAWLDSHTTPAATDGDQQLGQVLVWHEDGELVHAAVTIGDGLLLQKPSQSWSSPFGVWTVQEVIHHWRVPGVRLSRRAIVPVG